MFIKLKPTLLIENRTISAIGILDTGSNRICINRSFIEEFNLGHAL